MDCFQTPGFSFSLKFHFKYDRFCETLETVSKGVKSLSLKSDCPFVYLGTFVSLYRTRIQFIQKVLKCFCIPRRKAFSEWQKAWTPRTACSRAGMEWSNAVFEKCFSPLPPSSSLFPLPVHLSLFSSPLLSLPSGLLPSLSGTEDLDGSGLGRSVVPPPGKLAIWEFWNLTLWIPVHMPPPNYFCVLFELWKASMVSERYKRRGGFF